MYFKGTFIAVFLSCCQPPLSLCQKTAISSVKFHKPPTCPRHVPRDYQVEQTVTSTSILSCTVVCASSPSCNSVIFDRAAKTCHLSQQVAAADCVNMEVITDAAVYLQKKELCQNGGTPSAGTCDCLPGFMGDNCELGPMRDCSDYKISGQASAVVRMIRPTDNVAFPVTCYNEMSTLMTRRNNKVNFTRSWREYRDGFGNVSDTHWLGLENMHILTSQNRKYQLNVQKKCNCFSLGKKPAGDCLSDLRGANFSTYDNDNDGDSSVNCASRHSGGWWFHGNTCSTCNPTGQLLQPANGLRTGDDSEVFWVKDLGNVAPYGINLRLQNL
ncbi:microfibril-associated glycoprotein 4-like [Pomacea canaliculata]|uniref:microfibril-associated glycoprotein 4-like n=1 Tax=Pomacea canaliculata TaxID=400727 RepID=UPI000D739C2A|nr:microfibril-associated glycoprotein 4-like [Pomacea canaliculata]